MLFWVPRGFPFFFFYFLFLVFFLWLSLVNARLTSRIGPLLMLMLRSPSKPSGHVTCAQSQTATRPMSRPAKRPNCAEVAKKGPHDAILSVGWKSNKNAPIGPRGEEKHIPAAPKEDDLHSLKNQIFIPMRHGVLSVCNRGITSDPNAQGTFHENESN